MQAWERCMLISELIVSETEYLQTSQVAANYFTIPFSPDRTTLATTGNGMSAHCTGTCRIRSAEPHIIRFYVALYTGFEVKRQCRSRSGNGPA